MSDMPQQRASTDVHTDPGPPVHSTIDELRDEVRSLGAMVREQQRALEQIGSVESEAVALTRSLPDRLGSAIAAAIEARQASFLLEAERAASSLKASLRDMATHSQSLAARVDDRRSEITDAAARVLETSERLGAMADRTRAELERLDDRIAELPEVTGAVVDDRTTELRERITRLADQLDRQEGHDLGTELRSRLEQLRAGLHDSVRQGMSEELAAMMATLTERIQEAAATAGGPTGLSPEALAAVESAATSAVASLHGALDTARTQIEEVVAQPRPLPSGSFDDVGEQVTARLAPTLNELRESVSVLLGRGDPTSELSGQVADLERQLVAVDETLTGQVLAAEERLLAQVQAAAESLAGQVLAADRTDELQHGLGELGAGIEATIRSALEELQGDLSHAVSGGLEELRADVGTIGRVETVQRSLADLDARVTEGLAKVSDAQAPIDELHAAVQRLAAVIRELATRDETAVTGRLDEISQRIADLSSRPEPLDPTGHLDHLAERIDGLAERPEPLDPSRHLEDLAKRIGDVAERFDRLVSPDDLKAVRADVAGARIAGEQSAEVASVMAQRVDDRLDELASRIAGVGSGVGPDALSQLEARVDGLAATLDEVATAVKKLRRPPLRAQRKPAAAKKKDA